MSKLWILFSVVAQLVVTDLFMKHSSPALIPTEPRGHAGIKESNKTRCNQNMAALPFSDDL